MAYREPDPEQQANGERQLLADARLEADADAGRLARTDGEPGAEKRLVGGGGSPGLASSLIVLAGGVGASMAAGSVILPLQVAAFVGGAIVAGAGCVGFDRLRVRRELAWVARAGFPVLGYVEILSNRRVTYAVKANITVATIEPEDRDRVLDLLGHLDTVDPTVSIIDTTIKIDALVAPGRRSLKRYLRGLVEHVGARLHEARRVVSLELLASTAERSKPIDWYG